MNSALCLLQAVKEMNTAKRDNSPGVTPIRVKILNLLIDIGVSSQDTPNTKALKIEFSNNSVIWLEALFYCQKKPPS